MQSQARTNQGGSVVGFVVVGVVLVAVAIGAIYLVQERSQHTQQPTPSPTVSTTKSPQPSSTNEDDESKKKQPQPSPQSTKPPSATKGQDNLPKTGPEDTLLSIIASASLVGMTVAYARSLRYRLQGVPERSMNSRIGDL